MAWPRRSSRGLNHTNRPINYRLESQIFRSWSMAKHQLSSYQLWDGQCHFTSIQSKPPLQATRENISMIRINFISPGQSVGRKEDQPFEDATAHFLRSLTFRSTSDDHIQDVAQQITELRKAAVRREQEKKELADVVEQDKLVVIRSKSRLLLRCSRLLHLFLADPFPIY